MLKRILIALSFWIMMLAVGLLLLSVASLLINPDSVYFIITSIILFLVCDTVFAYGYFLLPFNHVHNMMLAGLYLGFGWAMLFAAFDFIVDVLILKKGTGYLSSSWFSYIIVIVAGIIGGLWAQRRVDSGNK